MHKFEMGFVVKDKVTGFRGTITACSEYMTGCIQYLVTPKQKEDSVAYPTSTWLDEDRLELVEEPDKSATDSVVTPGGPPGSAPIK